VRQFQTTIEVQRGPEHFKSIKRNTRQHISISSHKNSKHSKVPWKMATKSIV